MNIANCSRCGKVFARNFRDICQNCYQEIEEEYQACVEYLRENKGTHITELSEATGVSVKQITKFVREGRISMMDAPNLTYPCEVCGVPIREGTMCTGCRDRLKADFSSASSELEARNNGANAHRTYKIGDRQ